MPKFVDKNCCFCGVSYRPTATHQKFCSTKCRDKERWNRDKIKRIESAIQYSKTPKYKQKRKERNRQLRFKQYGLSEEQFFQYLAEQNSQCLGCKDTIDEWSAKIDHNHTTNKTRRLLCINCNWAIGHSKDNVQTLKNLANYLEQYD